MMESFCIPCYYGDHAGHIEYPELPSPGVMGGHHCPCKGECVEEYVKRMPSTNVQAISNERPE